MKYHQILSTLTGEPLIITDSAQRSLVKFFEDNAMTKEQFRNAKAGQDIFGDVLPEMEMANGVAIVPIVGPIARGFGSIWKLLGGCDTMEIEANLDRAEQDRECRAILLDINSPGGTVTGTPELADRILRVQKPIYSFSAGQICSSAYWLAAGTTGIFATKSADIGCIGVYLPSVDMSERAKQLGLKVKVFSSGKYKGMGYPGTSLTPEQEELLQDDVVGIASMFYSHVRTNRPGVPDDAMQGQTFMGAKAVAAGLVDQLVSDRNEVLRLI